ncbi:LSM domain protein [Calycina marina]|uniref:LSM domain protein n=1 Tax=Calycina marina TaxID=1763456 RepID=A0A9P7ZBJ7_9HELO|nr:LSM domain protein [Calycina marina]
MDKAQAEDYLSSLLNKSLRVTTNDTRMFLGVFKCTDSDRNIILAQTFEYRMPLPPKPSAGKASIKQDMISRYLGLVVVPGEYITKIEVEEFASQMKDKTTSSVGETRSHIT